MNAVFDSLIENLREIKIVTEPTPASFTKDRINTGNSREFTISQFVGRYFPTGYITRKGHIFSIEEQSQEIDSVLLAPNHPQLITYYREIIIAEGVHAAIELKPDIVNNTEFDRGLEQIRSVKRLNREVNLLNYSFLGKPPKPDYFKKIPTYLFTFKTKTGNEIINTLTAKIKQEDFDLYDLPDFIVTLDNGILCFVPFASQSIFCDLLNSLYGVGNYPKDVFIHFDTKNETTLAVFLLTLFSVQPPEIQMEQNILKKYLSSAPNDFEYTVHSISIEEK